MVQKNIRNLLEENYDKRQNQQTEQNRNMNDFNQIHCLVEEDEEQDVVGNKQMTNKQKRRMKRQAKQDQQKEKDQKKEEMEDEGENEGEEMEEDVQNDSFRMKIDKILE